MIITFALSTFVSIHTASLQFRCIAQVRFCYKILLLKKEQYEKPDIHCREDVNTEATGAIQTVQSWADDNNGGTEAATAVRTKVCGCEVGDSSVSEALERKKASPKQIS